MKAVVNDKNHLTFVSHLSGVTIIESSGVTINKIISIIWYFNYLSLYLPLHYKFYDYV